MEIENVPRRVCINLHVFTECAFRKQVKKNNNAMHGYAIDVLVTCSFEYTGRVDAHFKLRGFDVRLPHVLNSCHYAMSDNAN